MRRKWQLEKNDLNLVQKLQEETMLDEFTLRTLIARGIDTQEEIDKFMRGTVYDLYDSRLMKDAEEAVSIILTHREMGHKLCIYTDYDCDGGMGGSCAYIMAKEAGIDVCFYANNRFTQGYGLCKSGIDEILSKYPEVKIILTVDNGISAHDGIKYAKSKGLTVIVTDHHEPGCTLPEADAIVNPKRKDDTYPFKGLCGAGVIWKLMLYLYYKLDIDLEKAYDVLDIVAVATVGDLVPLVDENRIIVKRGLELIKAEKRPVFRFFREVTKAQEINAHFTLGFQYCPMINSVGRLDGTIDTVINAFISNDEDTILQLVTYMFNKNEERKTLTIEQEKLSLEIVNSNYGEEIPEILIVFDPSFHEGIIGLVAGRLKESFNRPVIVLTENNGHLKGSARSIEGLHIKEALDKCKSLLLGYGGHDMAAGLSIEPDNLEPLREFLLKVVKETLTEDDFVKKYKFIQGLNANQISLDMVDAIRELEPFGMGFPKPLIKLTNFKVNNIYSMGEDKNHLKLVGNGLSIISWRGAEHYDMIGNPNKVKALGSPEINVYQNKVNLQFIVDGDNLYKEA